MADLFAKLEEVLDKLYAFIAKIFGVVDGFTNPETDGEEIA